MHSGITALVKNSANDVYDFATLSMKDFEFVQMVGNIGQAPTTTPGFVRNAMAVKRLAGQGSVYVRLTRSLRKSPYVFSTDSDSYFDIPDVSAALRPSASTSVRSQSEMATSFPTSAAQFQPCSSSQDVSMPSSLSSQTEVQTQAILTL